MTTDQIPLLLKARAGEGQHGRLPFGSIVKDAGDRIGEVFDYGLTERDETVYYLRDRTGEWWREAFMVTALPGWPGGSAA